jgi:hypothetical protein
VIKQGGGLNLVPLAVINEKQRFLQKMGKFLDISKHMF